MNKTFINVEFTSAKIFKFTLVILMTLVLSSTIYDLFARRFKKKREEKPNQLLTSFSLLINVRKLLNLDDENETFISCINGIRSLSIISIIFLHSYTFRIFLASFSRRGDVTIIEDFHETRMASSISAINISVDSFFVIAGALITRTTLKHLHDRKRFDVVRIFIQRYFRITPTLAFVMLLNDYLATQVSENENDTFLNYSMKPCRKYWLSTLLHAQNYFNSHAMCMHTTWQLSVDWQMFLMAPFLIYLLWKFNNKCLWLLYAIIAASSLYILKISVENKFIVQEYDLTPDFLSPLYREYYYPTHTRCASYIIGIILGYHLQKFNMNQRRMPTMKDEIFTSLSLSVIIAPVFMKESYEIMGRDVIKNAIYLSLARVVWATAIAWQIYSCCCYDGKWNKKINKFLSSKYWLPISRIGLSIYLIHPVIQYNLIAVQKHPLSLDALIMLGNFLKDLLLSFLASSLVYISVEEPFTLIGKYITRNINHEKKKND